MIYQPSEDSYLLKKQVKLFSKNKTVLDMGSGSGIQAETALSSEAKSVLASDINPESIALLKSIGIQTIKSNLFQNINGKFDLIIFNPPYLPEDKREDKESQLATTGGKKGDEILIKFLKQAKIHLNKQGVILTLLSSLTPRGKILKLLNQLSLKHKVQETKKLFMETLEVWKITNQNI